MERSVEISEIEKNFVSNFIYKNKRKRVLFELQSTQKRRYFLKRLNHQIFDIIDNDKLHFIPKTTNSNFSYIKQVLDISNKTPALIISNYDDLDGQLKNSDEAYKDLEQRTGLASMIVFEDGSKIFIQEEQEEGAPRKYIGQST
jgi:hypothetical protein